MSPLGPRVNVLPSQHDAVVEATGPGFSSWGLSVGHCGILEKLLNSAVVWFPQLFGGGRSATLPGPCEDDVHVRATCVHMCACLCVCTCA